MLQFIYRYFIYIMVFYFSLKTIQGQVYFPILDTTSIWMESISYSGGDLPFGYIEQYFIQGDTIYNGTNYKKLHYTTQHFSWYSNYFDLWIEYGYQINQDYPNYLMREDIAEKKVYLQYSPFDTMEILLYDFSLNVGDTIPRGLGWQLNFVSEIDSILIGGSYRKRFKIAAFEMPTYSYASIIEGVGSTFGLIAALEIPFETGEHLLCFTNNGETTVNFSEGEPHPADSTSHCYFYEPTIGISKSKPQTIAFFPNPVSDVLFIEIPSNITKGQIKIYNSTKQLQSEYFCNPCSSNSLSIDEFTPGIYYLVFINENQTYFGKFVKL